MSRALPRRERATYDYYPTPSWCVARLLEAVELPGGLWLEPAVGDGSIVRAVQAVREDVRWTTVDVRPDVEADLHADFAWCHCPELDAMEPGRGSFDVVLTNPPYGQAAEFVIEARRRAPVVAMLLRLGWLASEERRAYLADATPDVYVLPNRPSFDGCGTDAADYAWMIWSSRARYRPAEIRILRTTPVAERRTR